MSAMASQITSLTILYSTVYSSANQRKHQSSASLAFVRGIHRWSVNSPHKGPVTRKMFPFNDVIMNASPSLSWDLVSLFNDVVWSTKTNSKSLIAKEIRSIIVAALKLLMASADTGLTQFDLPLICWNDTSMVHFDNDIYDIFSFNTLIGIHKTQSKSQQVSIGSSNGLAPLNHCWWSSMTPYDVTLDHNALTPVLTPLGRVRDITVIVNVPDVYATQINRSININNWTGTGRHRPAAP